MAKIIKNEELDEVTLARLTQDEKDWIYNALDVCVTFEVHDKQLAAADDIALATAAFSRSLMAPILEMNMRGTRVDEAERERVVSEFRNLRAKLEKNFLRIIYEGIGVEPPFNWRSHAQLKFLFYTILGLKPYKARNSAGVWAPSVNREALERISLYFTATPLCAFVLALRDLDKSVQFLENEVDGDHRMRTSFNIGGTNTGRLSSSTSDYGTGGNMQNWEKALRRIYIPDEGMKFCNIDLEQADSRHVGAICWELFVEEMGAEFAGSYLDACELGDLHTNVARMVWQELDWPVDSKAQRALADQPFYRHFSRRDQTKRLGHGTNFYGTPRTMSQKSQISYALINDFQTRYFAAFPVLGLTFDDRKSGEKRKLVNWHNWVRKQIDQFGYIITPFYRRRRFFFGRPDDDKTLREAIAYAPQSMTADTIDTGIINLWRWGKVELLLQVHDSVLFQYPAARESTIIPEAIRLTTLHHELKKGRKFHVPAEAKVGWNWADFEEKTNPRGLVKWTGEDERA